MSFGKFKNVDFFRRVPIDLTEPSAPGAIISICAAAFMTYLFIGELGAFITPETRSDMFVAQDAGQKLKINFNMTFPHLPCFGLSLDVLDIMGRHEVGVARNVIRTRMNPDSMLPLGVFTDEVPTDDHAREQKGEGCNIDGFILVNKVPGNFHISAHGLQNYIVKYLDGRVPVAHTIHTLWMGDEAIPKKTAPKQIYTLDGFDRGSDDHTTSYEYFLDVVPTVIREGSVDKRAYQFTANFHHTQTDQSHMPAVFFRYQLSPVTVQFSTDRQPLFHFFTYVCAIIGGVYSVAGIASSIFCTTAVQIQRRFLGKDN
jgi:hypothetical protein